MDVYYALINADVGSDGEIWCEPLPGMNIAEGKYKLLKKAFYGHK